MASLRFTDNDHTCRWVMFLPAALRTYWTADTNETTRYSATSMDVMCQLRDAATHDVGLKRRLVTFMLAATLIIAVPIIHLGMIYSKWSLGKPEVDTKVCRCGCFDTIFKGTYENPPSRYKHFYFNSTYEMIQIWVVIVLPILLLYETIKHVIGLVWTLQVRRSMLVLFLVSFYPHYYGWWVCINYINDGFYKQWWHQIYFTATELLATLVILQLCNKDNKMTSHKLLIIMVVNLAHMSTSGMDQFFYNVILRKGKQFQVARDLALMTPDLVQLAVCIWELRRLARTRNVPIWRIFKPFELFLSLLVIISFSLVIHSLSNG